MNKGAMLQHKFAVQVTTLPDYDDITRFDGNKILGIKVFLTIFA